MATAAEIDLLIRAKGDAEAKIKQLQGTVSKLPSVLQNAQRAAGLLASGLGKIGGAPLAAIERVASTLGSLGGSPLRGVMSLVDGLGKLGLAGMGLQLLKDGAQRLAGALGVGLASEMEQTRAQFMAFTKDASKTGELLEMVTERAAKTPFAFAELAKATAGLMPAAKQAKVPLEELVSTAEILAASNPEAGLEGAAYALREAVSGDFTSIIERFNLPRQYINTLEDEGVPALEAVRRAMLEMGYDADLVANMGQTLNGRWSTFLDTIDGLRRTASQGVFDGLKNGLMILQTALDENSEALTSFASRAGDVLGGLVSRIVSGLPTAIDAVKTFFGAIQGDWFGSASASIDPFVRQIGQIGVAINRDVLPHLRTARDAFLTFAGALSGDWLGSASSTIEPFVQAVGNIGIMLRRDVLPAVSEFVSGTIGYFQELGGGVLQILNGDIAGGLSTVIQAFAGRQVDLAAILVTWGETLVSWVAPYIPPLLAELARLAEEAFAWAQSQTPAWLEKLQVWGDAIWQWVEPAIPPLLAALGGLAASVLAEIAAQAPGILQQFLTTWLPAHTEWVLQAATELLPRLEGFASGVLSWIRANGPGIIQTFLAEWVPAFVGWVAQAAIEIVPKLLAFAVQVNSTLMRLAAEALLTAAQIGVAIVQGVVQGVWANQGRLLSALRDLATIALNAAKEALGIQSPSKVMAEEVGEPLAEGIAAGIDRGASDPLGAIADLTGQMIQMGQEGVARVARAFDSLRRGGEVLTWLRDLTSGTFYVVSQAAIAAEDALVNKIFGPEVVAAVQTLREELGQLGVAMDLIDDEIQGQTNIVATAKQALDKQAEAFDRVKTKVDGLREALSRAREQLDDFTSAPLEGEREQNQVIFGLRNAINLLKYQREQLIQEEGAKDDPDPKKRDPRLVKIDEEIKRNEDRLRLEELKQRATYDGQRNALKQIADTAKSISFEEAYKGAEAAREAWFRIRDRELPAAEEELTQQQALLDAAKQNLETQQDLLDGLRERYQGLKEKVEEWKRQLDAVLDVTQRINQEREKAATPATTARGGSIAGATINATIYNDQRGMSSQDAARHGADSLAQLARTRLMSGAI